MIEVVSPLWEILVACQWRDGKPVRTRHHKEWDKYVFSRTGGLTLFKPARGKWLANNGRFDDERMIPVRIGCSEETIRDIAKFTLRHYEQEAVFVYLISTSSITFYRE